MRCFVPAFLVACGMVLGGCMDSKPSEEMSTVPGTDPRVAEPTCKSAVASKTEISSNDLIAANTRATASGAVVEVFRIGGMEPWLCELDPSGNVVSISAK